VASIAQKAPVFLDHKFFDIPSTMESAIHSAFEAGAQFATVHALSGPVALSRLAALEKELNQEAPFRILAVTLLTSFDSSSLPTPLRSQKIEDIVMSLAADVVNSGLRGIVCSPDEVEALRKKFPEAYLVTPGVRRVGADVDDQKRVATPAEAIKKGASALVIGRPIIEARDPRQALADILASLN
jgi:orotidine-5'-phosphate decarboxylase